METEGARLRDVMRAALDERHMTVSALAKEAGIQRPLIYQWWRGEQAPARTSLSRIAKPLGLDVSELAAIYGIEKAPAAEATGAEVGTAIVEAVREQTMVLRAVLVALAGPRLDPDLQEWAERVFDAVTIGSPLPKSDHPDETAG